MKITKIQAMEVLDSRNPTIQTTVWAGDECAKASVPSGASTGVHEALELRDNDSKRYGSKGVLKACKNVNKKIFKVVKGISADRQGRNRQQNVKFGRHGQQAKLGANAILSVSLAVCPLGCKIAPQRAFSYLAQTYGYTPKTLPTPFFNVINGGAHADSGLDIQEFFIIPLKGSFATKLRMGAEVFHQLKSQLAKQGLTVAVGDEGGFAPKLIGGNETALKQLTQAIKSAKYILGRDFALGMDAAASVF